MVRVHRGPPPLGATGGQDPRLQPSDAYAVVARVRLMRIISYPKRVVESVANLRFFGGICLPLVLVGSAAQVACGDGSLSGSRTSASPSSGRSIPTPSTPYVASILEPCRLPVAISGSPPQIGWLDLPAGRFSSDATATAATSKDGYVAWDSSLGKWLPTEPVMISPDGSRYIPEDAPNQIANARTGATVASFPAGNYNRVIGWTAAGIYLTHIGQGFLPGLWRIDPSSGAVTNLTPTSQVIWEIVDKDSAWGFEWSPTNMRIIDRLDLSTGAIRHLYDEPTVNEFPDATAFVETGVLVLVGGAGSSATDLAFVLDQAGSISPVAVPAQLSSRGNTVIDTLQDGQAALFSGQFGVAAYDSNHGLQMLFESPQIIRLLGDCIQT